MYLRSGLCPEPRWGSLQRLPRPHSWCGGASREGLAVPPQEPVPALSLWTQISALQVSGVPLRPRKDMGSVSDQNCCEGFRFTEKVKNTGYNKLKLHTAIHICRHFQILLCGCMV